MDKKKSTINKIVLTILVQMRVMYICGMRVRFVETKRT